MKGLKKILFFVLIVCVGKNIFGMEIEWHGGNIAIPGQYKVSEGNTVNQSGDLSIASSSGGDPVILTVYGTVNCGGRLDLHDATINIAGGTWNQTSGDAAIYSGGYIDMSAGTVNWDSSASVLLGGVGNSYINISGGVWNHNAGHFDIGGVSSDQLNVYSNGVFNWNSDGRFSIDSVTGNLSVSGAAKFIIGNRGTFAQTSRNLSVFGTMNIPSDNYFKGSDISIPAGGGLYFGGGKTLEIQAGTSFTLQSGATCTVEAGGGFKYFGTVTTNPGGIFNLFGENWMVGEGNTLTLSAGNMLNVSSTSTLDIGTGNTFVVALGTDFRYSGSIDTIASGGLFNLFGANNWLVGDGNVLTLTAGSRFDIPATSTIAIGNGNIFHVAPVLDFRYSGSIATTENGAFKLFQDNWLVGLGNTLAVTSGNTFNVVPTSTVLIGAGNTLQVDALGTLDIKAGSSFDCYGAISNAGQLTVGSNSDFSYFGSINNAGTFNFMGASASTPNSSTIQLNSGTFSLDVDGALTIGLGKTLNVQSGTSLWYVGDFNCLGTLNFMGASATAPTLRSIQLNSGTCTLPLGSSITNGGLETITVKSGAGFTVSGYMENYGNFTVESGANFNFNGTMRHWAGTFNFMGSPALTPDLRTLQIASGTLTLPSSRTLTLGASNILDVQSGVSLSFAGYLDCATSFSLMGAVARTPDTSTIRTDSGTCTLPSGQSLTIGSGKTLNIQSSSSFDFGGNLNCSAGTLSFMGAPASTPDTSTIAITSGACSVGSGSLLTIENAKTFQISSGVIFDIFGSIINNSGTLTIESGSTLNFQGSLFNSGGTFNFMGASAITPDFSTIRVNTGTCTLPVGKTISIGAGKRLDVLSGASLMLSGYLANAGVCSIAPGANVNFGGNILNDSTGVIGFMGALASTPNSSTIRIYSGTSLLPVGSVLTVGIGKTIEALSGTNFEIYGSINNGGTLLIDPGTSFDFSGNIVSNGTLSFMGAAANMQNPSAININAGTMSLPANTSLNIGAGKTLSIQPGSSCEFYGSLASAGIFNLFASNDLVLDGNKIVIGAGKNLSVPASSSLALGDGVGLNVSSDGVFDVQLGGTVILEPTANFDFAGDINNSGLLSLFGNSNISLPDSKTIQFNGGTCSVEAGGGISIASAHAINLEGTTLTLQPGTSFGWLGSVNNNGGAVTWYGIPISQEKPTEIILASGEISLPAGTFLKLGSDKSFTIEGAGTLKNLSSSTIDIDGMFTVAGTLENGDISNPGFINVNSGGTLFLPGGTVINKNAGSSIAVNRAGSLLNYYGRLDVATGSFSVAAGGEFATAGTFTCNDTTLTFSNGCSVQDLNYISLNRDLDLDITWTISVSATIEGNGNNITLLPTGGILVGSGASVTFKDVELMGIAGTNIRCQDDTATIILNNVSWNQDADYSFAAGNLDIYGDVNLHGPQTIFGFSSSGYATVHSNASLNFDCQMTLSYASGYSDLLSMQDATANIKFDFANFYVDQDCDIFGGNLVFDNHVTLSVANGMTLTFGDGFNVNNDVNMLLYSAANVEMFGNVVVNNVNA